MSLSRKAPLARRTPMARGTAGLARGGRLPPRSAKRVADMVDRRILVAAMLEAWPVCQAQWVCNGARAVDVHERLKRSRGGSITDANHGHMVTVCRRCHEMTETLPAEATRRRMLLPSWHRCPPVGPC
jgi:hypothetical protein